MVIDNLNGQAEEKIAGILQDDITVGYVPIMPLEALWMSGNDMPQITLRQDLEFMQMHPIVQTALEYYKSGVMGAEFWGGPDFTNPDNQQGRPISLDPRVAQFVLLHADRFWQRGVPLLQEGGYPYGWAPGEHIYKDTGGMLVWDHMKGFRPNDGFVLSYGHQPVGIRVKNIRDPVTGTEPRPNQGHGGTADLWFASETIPAKAAWYSHRARFGQYYGRSQLMSAWRPWRRLGWRDAVEQVIDAAIYRAGYKGPIVRHPPEDMQTAQIGVPATQADSRGMPRRSARDVARQLVEWAKAGAGFTLSSAKYPQAQGGGDKWGIEWPDHVMDVRPLVEAARYLEDQIMLGVGVPPELVRAGGTGSGYSGRSVPREAFLCGQQRIADQLLQLFVEQVIRPLVLWNFGDIPFEISCKSLLQTQSEEGAGGAGAGGAGGQADSFKRSQAAKDAWAIRNQNKPQQQPGQAQPPQAAASPAQPAAPQPAPAFSLDDPVTRTRVLGIVERVLRRAA